MDTSDTRMGHSVSTTLQVQPGGSGAPFSCVAHTIATQIVVMPFQSNSQTPRAIENVPRLRATNHSMERWSLPEVSPWVSADELKKVLSLVCTQHHTPPSRPSLESPRSDRPTRGRVFTVRRMTPAADG
jgi:hypothetical protein